jgi:hypothetical protein
VRTRAEVVGETDGGWAQVRAGWQPHEPDRETVLVAQTDLDAVVVDDDRDVLTWDSSHVLPPVVEMRFADVSHDGGMFWFRWKRLVGS